jgi:hypothetical protein
MRPPLSNGNNAQSGVASDDLSLQDNHFERAPLSLEPGKAGRLARLSSILRRE